MTPEAIRNGDQLNSDSNEFQDTAARQLRLIRMGVRNKDQGTLDAVKKDLQLEYGDAVGAKVFEKLLLEEIEEINKRQLEEKHPELKGKI